jgi:hypothetical protein
LLTRRTQSISSKGRPVRLDKTSYKKNRSAVERFNALIESFKKILVKFEQLAVCFIAAVNLLCIRIGGGFGMSSFIKKLLKFSNLI